MDSGTLRRLEMKNCEDDRVWETNTSHSEPDKLMDFGICPYEACGYVA
uniref:Uncharacterized protein n=1 Tax=Peronospora matthiolae TaxID=2874970 RepID=A0AAV1VNE3_9STRA